MSGIRRIFPAVLVAAPCAWLAIVPCAVFARPSSFARVEPVSPGEVHWTTGFWADRFELCRTQTIPSLERLMVGTNYTHFLRNFEVAAGVVTGRHRGAPFNDGELYKWLEAASASLGIERDSALEARLDRIIAVIAKAQRPDGYLHTPVLIRQRQGDPNAAPFQDRNHFELYNLGHLFTAAAVHYRVTGRTNLLGVAVRAAAFLEQTLAGDAPEAARSAVCPSHYMGLVDLYRATGQGRYLALARKLFALRARISEGGDDNQDRLPFEQQTEAAGHAVRANYLYAGAADLFLETGDPGFWQPLGPIWTNVMRRKMYVTGGCGALYDGASPDGATDQKSITRVHQAYGRNYQLPNITAHNETCANIGNVLWNWRMFLATGEAQFMDVVELALYNSVLSGVSLDGTNYFYTNPLRVTDPMPVELRWPRQRAPFLSSFCCPPNLARTLAHSPEFAYAKSAGTIWVNLYGGSELTTELEGVGKLRLTQETEYPWSGRVRFTVREGGTNAFAMKLRIPGWAKGAALRVNLRPVAAGIPSAGEPGFEQGGKGAAGAASAQGSTMSASVGIGAGRSDPLSPEAEVAAATYAEIRRMWQPGDFVDLDLPMPVRLLEANPLVEETLNQVAVQRGPVVYCLESPDLPGDVRLTDVAVPADATFLARFDRRLLGGVVVLDATLLAKPARAWAGQLYREFRPTALKPVRVSLIPYAVWGNRGRSEMTVWLPLASRPGS